MPVSTVNFSGASQSPYTPPEQSAVDFTTATGDPLVFAYQPADVSVAAPAIASFSAPLSGGTSPYTYQWYEVTAGLLPGETSDVLSFVTMPSDHNTQYYCVGEDDLGAMVTSDTATLTVSFIPMTVVTQPSSTSAYDGAPASFYFAATGFGALSYQWYEVTAGLLPGETSQQLSLTSVVLADDGNQYYCVATDGYGATLQSNTVTLTVLPQPVCVVTDVRVLGPDGQWVSIMASAPAVDPTDLLNDNRIALDQTWSSSKINLELQGKANLTDIPDTRRYVHGGSAGTIHTRSVHGGDASTLHSIFHVLHGGTA